MIRKINGNAIRNFSTGATANVTGVTTETKMQSILIPADTFAVGDLIELEAMFTKVGVANTVEFHFKTNTIDGLSGAIDLGIFTTISTDIFLTMSRRFVVRDLEGGGTGLDQSTSGLKASSSQENDYLSDVQSDFAINWSADLYIMCTAKLTSSSDSVTQRFLKVFTP